MRRGAGFVVGIGRAEMIDVRLYWSGLFWWAGRIVAKRVLVVPSVMAALVRLRWVVIDLCGRRTGARYVSGS